MPGSAHPTWDVHGLMAARSGDRASQIAWRLRCYRDGHGVAEIDGLCYPLPATMTVVEYMEMVFTAMFADPAEVLVAGD